MVRAKLLSFENREEQDFALARGELEDGVTVRRMACCEELDNLWMQICRGKDTQVGQARPFGRQDESQARLQFVVAELIEERVAGKDTFIHCIWNRESHCEASVAVLARRLTLKVGEIICQLGSQPRTQCSRASKRRTLHSGTSGSLLLMTSDFVRPFCHVREICAGRRERSASAESLFSCPLLIAPSTHRHWRHV